MAKSKTKEKPAAKGISASAIVEDQFGNYRIRAGQLSGVFVARAFPRSSAKSQGLMAEARGASEEEAIAALKTMLTAREAERTAARRWDARTEASVPTQEEFFEALGQTKLSDAQRAIFKAQAIAGEAGLPVVSLMNAGGYKSQDATIKTLSKAGALLADFIGIEILIDDTPDPDAGLRFLGYQKDSETNAPAQWIMHEELRSAVWETL